MVKIEIKLIVVTTSGTVTETFTTHDTFQHVQDHVFAKLRIAPSPNDQWQLSYDGRVLPLTETIEQAKLPSGAKLTLAPREGGGGAWTRR